MLRELNLKDSAPWKKRFRAPKILSTVFAKQAPGKALVTTNKHGVYQLYSWDRQTGGLKQLTNYPCGKLWGELSPDARHVYYHEDRGGKEIGHIVRVPFEGGVVQDVTPDMDLYYIAPPMAPTVSSAGNFLGFIISNPEGFQLYSINLGPRGGLGERHLLYKTKNLSSGPVVSYNGEASVIESAKRSGGLGYELLAFDNDGNRIGKLQGEDGEGLEAVAFSPLKGDLRLLAATNRTGVKKPLIWNPFTKERQEISLDKLEREVIPLCWSPSAKRILLCQFNQAVQQLYTYDLQSAALTRLNHPAGTFSRTHFTLEDELLVEWEDSTHPRQLAALDGRTGVQEQTILGAGKVPRGRPWKHVSFASCDGEAIQGWLGLPEGKAPFPAILNTHGGPTAVTKNFFSAESQAWLDHGFAFFSINYRGSITFGREFEQKIWGNPGFWEVEDMVAARTWLVREGVAPPDKVLLSGYSYGGYLTLQALGKYPELWAGGMAGAAIADWAAMYEDESDTIKAYHAGFLGGTPDEAPEQHAKSSPITYAENVRSPVMIMQMRNDTRAPARQMEAYEKKMKSLGKDIKVHWFETGHLLGDVEKDIKQQELMLCFAHRVIKE